MQIIYRQPLYLYVLPYGPVSSLELLQFMCFALGNNEVWTILPKQHHQRIPGTRVSSPLQSCGIGRASVSLLCCGHNDYFVYIPWKPYCLCHNRKYLDPKPVNVLYHHCCPHSTIQGHLVPVSWMLLSNFQSCFYAFIQTLILIIFTILCVYAYMVWCAFPSSFIEV